MHRLDIRQRFPCHLLSPRLNILNDGNHRFLREIPSVMSHEKKTFVPSFQAAYVDLDLLYMVVPHRRTMRRTLRPPVIKGMERDSMCGMKRGGGDDDMGYAHLCFPIIDNICMHPWRGLSIVASIKFPDENRSPVGRNVFPDLRE